MSSFSHSFLVEQNTKAQFPCVAWVWKLPTFQSVRSLTILVADKLGWKTNRNLTSSYTWRCSYIMNECSKGSSYTDHQKVSKGRETEPMRIWTSPKRSILSGTLNGSFNIKIEEKKTFMHSQRFKLFFFFFSLCHLWKYCINPRVIITFFGLRTILIIGKMILYSEQCGVI